MEYALHWLSRARRRGAWMLAAPSAAGLEGIFRRTAATCAASWFSSAFHENCTLECGWLERLRRLLKHTPAKTATTSPALQWCSVHSKDWTESGCLGKDDEMAPIVVRELQGGRQWKMDGALRRCLDAG
jgi:hypothetical protein